MVTAQGHVSNIHPVCSQNSTNLTYDSRNVIIFQQQQDSSRSCLDVASVNADDSGRSTNKRARNRHGFTFTLCLEFNQVRELAGSAFFGFDCFQAQCLRERCTFTGLTSRPPASSKKPFKTFLEIGLVSTSLTLPL